MNLIDRPPECIFLKVLNSEREASFLFGNQIQRDIRSVFFFHLVGESFFQFLLFLFLFTDAAADCPESFRQTVNVVFHIRDIDGSGFGEMSVFLPECNLFLQGIDFLLQRRDPLSCFGGRSVITVFLRSRINSSDVVSDNAFREEETYCVGISTVGNAVNLYGVCAGLQINRTCTLNNGAFSVNLYFLYCCIYAHMVTSVKLIILWNKEKGTFVPVAIIRNDLTAVFRRS